MTNNFRFMVYQESSNGDKKLREIIPNGDLKPSIIATYVDDEAGQIRAEANITVEWGGDYWSIEEKNKITDPFFTYQRQYPSDSQIWSEISELMELISEDFGEVLPWSDTDQQLMILVVFEP